MRGVLQQSVIEPSALNCDGDKEKKKKRRSSRRSRQTPPPTSGFFLFSDFLLQILDLINFKCQIYDMLYLHTPNSLEPTNSPSIPLI